MRKVPSGHDLGVHLVSRWFYQPLQRLVPRRAGTQSKNRGQTAVKAAMRAVGRGGDADAGAVAQLVRFVQHIQAITTQLQLADARGMHVPGVFDAQVHRAIGAQFFRVGKTRPQAGAVEEVRMDAEVFEQIVRNTAGAGEAPLMIQLHVVRGQVCQLVVGKLVFNGVKVPHPCLHVRIIPIDGEWPFFVSAAQFRAINRAGRVIKIVKDDRAAELAVVEQVFGQLAERVSCDLPRRGDLPREANVKVIVAFDFWRIIVVIERSVGGVFECLDCGRRNELQRGRHKVARIAEVEGGGGSIFQTRLTRGLICHLRCRTKH